ncbi:hypothetical protein Patl1_06877 [Pistacia atlantica]|uniref:Uncharacterized protein n=1 Tax=Pistacia atlantica TaxID=434234 RepID=A0ACC1AKZ8_9ROSI|nr:hypothetical protein Patl1_06877 [Pistacia atlantica]
MMFSIKCSGTDGQAEEARTLGREVTEIFGQFNISDIIWLFKNVDLQGFRRRFMDINKRFDSLLEKIISNREMVRKEKKKNGDVDDDEEDFMTAATDTTAMAAEWTLAELINNPNVLEKAQGEIDQVVGKSRLIQESDLPNLPYLEAIIKENFRLHPPIPMLARKSIEDCQIGKYTIPEGSLLFGNLWSIGRDPKVWNNPMKFNPERFLKPKESDGPGINIDELPTTLAAMIQCFNWNVVNPEGVEMKGNDLVDMSERPGLTAPRAYDLVCVPVARCSPMS